MWFNHLIFVWIILKFAIIGTMYVYKVLVAALVVEALELIYHGE